MSSEKYTNRASTTLSSGVNDSTTTLPVTAATGFPSAAQYRVIVEDEIMLVTAGAGTTSWTVTRGAEGTTAASHSSGMAVTHVVTAGALDQIRADDVQTAAYASQPAAEKAGRIFLPNDGRILQRDTGAAWANWGPLFPLTPPSLGSFAWQNQGATATVTTDQDAVYLTEPTANGDNVRGQTINLPATPFTVTMGCMLTADMNGGTAPNGGLLLRDGTPKNITFGPLVRAANGIKLALLKWDSDSHVQTTVFENFASFLGGIIWLRHTDDGSNNKWYTSGDGRNWILQYSESRTAYITATKVGFYVSRSSSAGNGVGLTVPHWVQS